jgi:hypothetical protein
LADSLPQLSSAYMENSRRLMDHLADIVSEHPNQWVAVHAGRIVAADADLGVVTATAAGSDSPADIVQHFVAVRATGVASRPECTIPATLATVECVLMNGRDRLGPLTIHAMPADTDRVARLLGMPVILDRLRLFTDLSADIAFLEAD